MGDSNTPRIEGLVIGREPAGERHLRLTVFDPERGPTRCLYKPVARSRAATVTPDLFDTAELLIDQPKAGESARFVREYRLVERIAGLGTDYTRLTFACRWANLLSKNPHPPESWATVYTLAGDALRAIADKPRPDAAYFKAVWKLTRDEGLPVKEDFFPKLRPGEQEIVLHLLNRPLLGIDETLAPKAAVEGVARALENWLAREADFIV